MMKTNTLPREELVQGNLSPLNQLEITSINALLAYTAHAHNVSADTIGEIVTTHFGVSDVAQLPSQHYDNVIRFLVDMQVELILN